MVKKLSIADAKSRFSETVRAAEHGDLVLTTRRGKPVVALVPAEQLKQLERLQAAGPEGGLASLAGGWEGADELMELIESSSRSTPRYISEFRCQTGGC